MNQQHLEAAVDAISILNNITDSSTSEILEALSGSVFSEQEVSEITDYMDQSEQEQ